MLRAAGIQAGDGSVAVHVRSAGIGNLEQPPEIFGKSAAVGLQRRALSNLGSAGRAYDNRLAGEPDRGIQVHAGPDVCDFVSDVSTRHEEVLRYLPLNSEIPVVLRRGSQIGIDGQKALVRQRWKNRRLGIVVIGVRIAAR